MNQVKIYRDYGKVDIRIIEEFEVLMGFKFPSMYKILLSEHDALIPSANHFTFLDKSNNVTDSREIAFDGFGDKVSTAGRMFWPQDYDVSGHKGLVTFGTSANGDYVCFDYRSDNKTDRPKVVLMLHDFFDDNQKMLICPVSNSFEDFIDSLYVDEQ
jgi:hypothetical protein